MIEQHIIASVAADLSSRARELQRKGMSAEAYWGGLAEATIEKYKALTAEPIVLEPKAEE